jgi:hypothetical protein
MGFLTLTAPSMESEDIFICGSFGGDVLVFAISNDVKDD